MKDKLSTLLDGDLDEQSATAVLAALARDASARQEWDTWCLIGDAMRGEHGGSVGFVDRVMAGIEAEPVLFAPASAAASAGRRSAWQSLMPIAASVMGVAAVGWVAHTLSGPDETGSAMLAVQSAPALVVEREAPVNLVDFRQVEHALPGDPHRAYVFVHQAMTGGGPIPGAVQYVRTVSDNRQDIAR
jgi:sigma-E factor negative regulatory protein RseA